MRRRRRCGFYTIYGTGVPSGRPRGGRGGYHQCQYPSRRQIHSLGLAGQLAARRSSSCVLAVQSNVTREQEKGRAVEDEGWGQN